MRFWLLFLLSFNVIANPLDAGDVKLGKQLVEKNCIACHAARFGGDGSKIYTREDRIIKTPKGLIQQVRNCNTNLGLKWFDDEELAAAAYLNQTYYHLQ
ncbi:MAG: cytochrome c [Methylophilales bacterium]|nr:cytochrome c [Methylophilales bacterium]